MKNPENPKRSRHVQNVRRKWYFYKQFGLWIRLRPKNERKWQRSVSFTREVVATGKTASFCMKALHLSVTIFWKRGYVMKVPTWIRLHQANCIYSHDTKKVGCMFFHVTHNCTRGDKCKFSHEAISPEELAELKRIYDEVEMEKHSVGGNEDDRV